MEAEVEQKGMFLQDLALEELEELWEKAKNQVSSPEES